MPVLLWQNLLLTRSCSWYTDAMQPTSENYDETNQPQVETETQTVAPDTAQPIHWQANEYIHHDRSPLWFIIFSVVIIALILLAIFVLNSITFAILVPVMAAALIVYTRRPPRVLDYTLSSKGLFINDQLYPFSEFKSFGVVKDGAEYSVMLIPVKRFHLGVSVYFPNEAGEEIVDMLGARLPMRDLDLDLLDRITRKLRI